MNREKLLAKIDGMNERIKQLKMQGESSKKAPIKSIRSRRSRAIKELIKVLTPETSYFKENEKTTKNNN